MTGRECLNVNENVGNLSRMFIKMHYDIRDTVLLPVFSYEYIIILLYMVYGIMFILRTSCQADRRPVNVGPCTTEGHRCECTALGHESLTCQSRQRR